MSVLFELLCVLILSGYLCFVITYSWTLASLLLPQESQRCCLSFGFGQRVGGWGVGGGGWEG